MTRSSPQLGERPQQPRRQPLLVGVVLSALLLGAGCGGADEDDRGAVGAPSRWIQTDGSATVEPFTALAAERFQRANTGVRITRSIVPSGTGGGFERFCAGETDLSYASRPINDEERDACSAQGIEYTAVRVANDAVTVVVNRRNDWADCLTTEELKEIWEPGSTVDNWSQVRSGFPAQELELFGPGADSGTFDYFTGEIVGEEGASRSDFLASLDHDLIVKDVVRTTGGLGFFGLPNFIENDDRLRAVEIDAGLGCVAPSVESAQTGGYPLSRSLFIYAKEESLRDQHVRAFVEYALENAVSLANDAKLVPLTAEQLQEERTKFDAAIQDGT